MDAESENQQPASSSINSESSSNSDPLSNLPLMPTLQASNNGEDLDRNDYLPMPSPPSPPPSLSLIPNQHFAQQQSTAFSEESIEDSSVQFNNNSTPPPTSSSSSSSSSHNHQLHHHSQHSTYQPQPIEHQPHFHHYHQQQHSSHPSPIQLEPVLLSDQQALQQEFSIDDGDIAESIDASAIVPIAEPSDLIPTEGNNVASVVPEERFPSFALPSTVTGEVPQSQKISNPRQNHYCNNLENSNQLLNIGGNQNTMFNYETEKANEPHTSKNQPFDRLKMLYPNVNENETPLPRCWSAHDKCLAIGLSNNNLRVRYKGAGKQHNEAASVRTAHPIPAACGLYYFEVKIISKGKNGYMGIGLTTQQFRMNRLPGWDKQSYGYHGDDGNSFSSSGNGQSYGPTFTTGDIIGCCVNFKHNLCFYTKNGTHLGTAFRDLPSKLYPTVGLQTPGEEVDANFGQEPFKFDQIEDLMKQMRTETITYISDFPLPAESQTPMGDPTALLHKWVSSYLVHNGYSSTAEAFARSTGQPLNEDLASIKNRQKIMKLVMAGKMGQAIEHTLNSYPGVLESNNNLLFMLKCRQFIEMVNGSDQEVSPAHKSLPNASINSSTQTTPINHTSVIQSTKAYQNGSSISQTASDKVLDKITVISADKNQSDTRNFHTEESSAPEIKDAPENESSEIVPNYFNDVDMENGHSTNGRLCKNGNSLIPNNILELDEEMDVDLFPSSSLNQSNGFERILEFGKELSQMGQQLEKENKMSSDDRQMLEDAFSLIAYSNPWSSPLGWQLCPSKRETVCSALNSAILESMNQPWRPPLEVCVSHASELLKVMARSWLGSGGFVSIEDIFSQN